LHLTLFKIYCLLTADNSNSKSYARQTTAARGNLLTYLNTLKHAQPQKQLAAQDTVYTMSVFSNIMNYCGFLSLPRANYCKSQNEPKNIHPRLISACGALLLRLHLNKPLEVKYVANRTIPPKIHNLSSLLGSGTVPAKASLHLNCALAKLPCCKSHNPT
jgi:hypothetical protein